MSEAKTRAHASVFPEHAAYVLGKQRGGLMERVAAEVVGSALVSAWKEAVRGALRAPDAPRRCTAPLACISSRPLLRRLRTSSTMPARSMDSHAAGP